jgi:hypothetical protein
VAATCPAQAVIFRSGRGRWFKPSQAHYTRVDLRERSSVVALDRGCFRASPAHRGLRTRPCSALLDDFGSSVGRDGGCYPVYGDVLIRRFVVQVAREVRVVSAGGMAYDYLCCWLKRWAADGADRGSAWYRPVISRRALSASWQRRGGGRPELPSRRCRARTPRPSCAPQTACSGRSTR